MKDWLRIETQPIHADVIKWVEPVFYYPKRKNGRSSKIGTREVTAEVLKIEGEWIFLLVLSCKKITEPTLRDVELFKAGQEIKRKIATVVRNHPERLLWSDESAREEILRD